MKSFVLWSAVLALGISSCKDAPEIQEIAAAEPTSSETSVERGKYLVEAIGCSDCHSPKIMTPEGPVPDPERSLSGFPADTPLSELSPAEEEAARKWVLFYPELTAAKGPWGISFAANITSDETGIGNWSFEQFKLALTQGKYKGLENSRPLLPPMPWQSYRTLKEEDLRAMYDYLKSTKPIRNVVPAPIMAPAPGE